MSITYRCDLCGKHVDMAHQLYAVSVTCNPVGLGPVMHSGSEQGKDFMPGHICASCIPRLESRLKDNFNPPKAATEIRRD